MNVGNVFDLVHHFGNEEDQISANFGFILKVNRDVLKYFLGKELALPMQNIKNKELREIDIETQIPYGGKAGERSKIDLQMKLEGRFIVFLESKLGGSRLPKDQLGKYGKILNDFRPFYDHLRLVLVTQFDRKEEFKKEVKNIMRKTGLRRKEFRYVRWEDIRQIVAEYNKEAKTKFINNKFLEYVGDKMSDKKIISEQKLKDIHEVLIASTDPDFWEVTLNTNTAFQENNCPDAQYYAFYRTSPDKAITHIAKVKYTERNVPVKETYKNFPEILKRAKKEGWIDNVHKVYHLEELIKLPLPIEKGKSPPVRAHWFKTLAQVFKARYLGDLK